MLRWTLLIFQQVQDQEMDIQRKIVEQGFLTFFASWTFKSEIKIPRTPGVSKGNHGGLLNSCKRGLNLYSTLLL
jgi:hypothetical protein